MPMIEKVTCKVGWHQTFKPIFYRNCYAVNGFIMDPSYNLTVEMFSNVTNNALWIKFKEQNSILSVLKMEKIFKKTQQSLL